MLLIAGTDFIMYTNVITTRRKRAHIDIPGDAVTSKYDEDQGADSIASSSTSAGSGSHLSSLEQVHDVMLYECYPIHEHTKKSRSEGTFSPRTTKLTLPVIRRPYSAPATVEAPKIRRSYRLIRAHRYRALTVEEEQHVHDVVYGLASDEVINTSITRKTMTCLQNEKCLNDEVCVRDTLVTILKF